MSSSTIIAAHPQAPGALLALGFHHCVEIRARSALLSPSAEAMRRERRLQVPPCGAGIITGPFLVSETIRLTFLKSTNALLWHIQGISDSLTAITVIIPECSEVSISLGTMAVTSQEMLKISQE